MIYAIVRTPDDTVSERRLGCSCSKKAQKMVAKVSSRRNDDQLGFILHETANWTVIGRHGVVLCEVPSLRIAIDRWADLTATGLKVLALVRAPHPEIVVFSPQVRMLANGLPEAEAGPVTVQPMRA